MEQQFSEVDFECLIGKEWALIGRNLRHGTDGLWLKDPSAIDAAQWVDDAGKTHELLMYATSTPTKPVLPLPFTMEQFKTFCDWHPTFELEAIKSVFTNGDGTVNMKNLAILDSRSRAAGALARYIIANPEDEHSQAWKLYCAMDDVEAEMVELAALKPDKISDIQYRHARLHELRAELAMLKQGVSATPSAQSPAKPAPLATAASTVKHSTKTRRDTLTPVIELAQKKCRNRQDAAEVWSALQVLADEKVAPLFGATEEGLQYLKGGDVAIFTRKSLGKRLAR